MVGIGDLRRAFPRREFIDESEVVRLEDVQVYVFFGRFLSFKREEEGVVYLGLCR